MRAPSVGFVLAAAVIASSGAFLLWGLATPRLDRVWQAHVELADDANAKLKARDRKALQSSLQEHPGLAAYLTEYAHAGLIQDHDQGRVEGRFAYLIRASAADPGVLTIRYRGTDPKGGVSVKAQAVGARMKGETTADAPFRWALPDDGPFPQLVTLELADRGKKKRRRHGVQIDLEAR